ncbi:MAG: right-handed parallel beta-helix repeat-containing protein, partial [Chloroflexi bacterium]|nr:right-handed parallel beta-helix repeat-containing protein [Chloroflexota bacterium]
YVNGRLTAVGTPTTPITFTAAVSNTSGYWGYLQIGGGSNIDDSDVSQLSYVTMEGGGYYSSNPTLYIYRSSPTLDHLTIRNSGGEGMQAYYGSGDVKGLTLDTAVIENNGEQGIYLRYGRYYTFTNITVQNNSGDGLYLYQTTNHSFTNLTSQNNGGDGMEISSPYIGAHAYNNVTLDGNSIYGLYNNSSNNTLTLLNSQISNNGVAARLPINSTLNNVTWTGNSRNEIEWAGGTLNQHSTWNRQPTGITAYHVVGDITIADGVSLTVGAGVNVIFNQYTGLFVNGQITAVGTPTDTITFTAAVSNTSGYWDYVQIGGGSVFTDSDGSRLSYVAFEGGGYSTNNPSLYIYRSSPTLDHLTIRNSGGEGIYVNNYYSYPGFALDTAVIENSGEQGIYIYGGNAYTLTNITLQNNGGDGLYLYRPERVTLNNATIQNNGNHGIYMYQLNRGPSQFSNLTVDNNSNYGIWDSSGTDLTIQDSNITNNGVAARLPVNSALSNVDWTGNGRNELEWNGGVLQQDAAWNRLPAGITTYHVVGDITVADGVSLTVGAGVNVIFNQYTGLFVNGQITAVGTPTNPITFTAAVSNTSGYWDFVQIGGGSVLTDSDSSQISYALLEGGGYPTYNPTLHIYR